MSLLHDFRWKVGSSSEAEPCGWESVSINTAVSSYVREIGFQSIHMIWSPLKILSLFLFSSSLWKALSGLFSADGPKCSSDSQLNLLTQEWLWFQSLSFLFSLIFLPFSGLCQFHTGSPELIKLILCFITPLFAKMSSTLSGSKAKPCAAEGNDSFSIHCGSSSEKPVWIEMVPFQTATFMCLGFHPWCCKNTCCGRS